MLIAAALVALSLPVVAWTGYLGFLAALSCVRSRAPSAGDPRTRFDVVVPAHNEEGGIAATVASLVAVDYPPELRRVVVVADNCTDATAARAAEAGASVLERKDERLRGKGYALAYAFERSLALGVDAVAVVDADTRATPNLLRAFDARLRAGAAAVQAHYGVANPGASWRTRLMHIGFTLFHDVRSRAREAIGVSAGLRGNGMAFSASTLREAPHDAFSIVEDVEYGIRLGRLGHRVHYAGEAQVLGEMVSSERASRSQRQRWEGGRWALARREAGGLLWSGIRRRNALLLDLAMDLFVPPLSYVVLASFGGAVVTAAAVALRIAAWWAIIPWGLALLGVFAYVARGLWLSRVGPRGIVDLLWAPVYILWKVVLALGPSRSRGWVRTTREGEKP